MTAPRFALGDVVFFAQVRNESVPEECLDCKGRGAWHVTTAAGEFDVACGTCARGWGEIGSGRIGKLLWRSEAVEGTVCGISQRRCGEDLVTDYQVDVGAVNYYHREDEELFADRESAWLAGEKRVQEQVRAQAEADLRSREHKRADAARRRALRVTAEDLEKLGLERKEAKDLAAKHDGRSATEIALLLGMKLVKP